MAIIFLLDYYQCTMNVMKLTVHVITVAPLTFPVQEVSSSPSQITIEMHVHDGPEVGHYMGDNMK